MVLMAPQELLALLVRLVPLVQRDQTALQEPQELMEIQALSPFATMRFTHHRNRLPLLLLAARMSTYQAPLLEVVPLAQKGTWLVSFQIAMPKTLDNGLQLAKLTMPSRPIGLVLALVTATNQELFKVSTWFAAIMEVRLATQAIRILIAKVS